MRLIFSVSCALFLLILPQAGSADLVEPKDGSIGINETNKLSGSSADDESHPKWSPEISIYAGSGHSVLPYGPPGSTHYTTKTRFTTFTLGLSEKFTHEQRQKRVYFGLKLQNNFPASARNYDLQAVSWLDFGAQSELFQIIPIQEYLLFHWMLGAELNYERFHYPKGVSAISGLPVRGGLGLSHRTNVLRNDVIISIEAEYSQFFLGRTAVKYDSVVVLSSGQANRVRFEPRKDVSGFDYQFSLEFAFLNHEKTSLKNTNRQHSVSLIWQNKLRNAQDFMTVLDKYDATLEEFDLNYRQQTLGVCWTEAF